ncbi:MAG: ABC-type transport system involved in multi-copper enzyme maturation permease subunit, partial [Planctomycetota bacterium]
MKATTHTETYRPFKGELRTSPFRFLTIGWSGIRHGFKRKLPLLLLFAPTTISGIIACVFVHLKFTAEAGSLGDEARGIAMIAALSGQLSEVASMITEYIVNVRFFALLAIAWYGSGLIAEDRRVGAHLLYFSRPITRLDYLLGKLTAAAFYGAWAILSPALLICLTACFSSPEWSFLTDK